MQYLMVVSCRNFQMTRAYGPHDRGHCNASATIYRVITLRRDMLFVHILLRLFASSVNYSFYLILLLFTPLYIILAATSHKCSITPCSHSLRQNYLERNLYKSRLTTRSRAAHDFDFSDLARTYPTGKKYWARENEMCNLTK